MSVKLASFFRKEYLLTHAFKVVEMINFFNTSINFFSFLIGLELKILYTSVYIRLDCSW